MSSSVDIGFENYSFIPHITDVGCHCIVNMLYYYYYCNNIVLVNKLACLLARRYQTFVYCQQFAIWKFYALY